MADSRTAFLEDEQATVAAGQCIGQQLQAGMTIFLEGTLGAGKTTLTRGILNAFGYSGAVKSPTYTLVENYDGLSRDDLSDNNPSAKPSIYHFDLYRLGDPEELEYMGIRDYFSAQSICIVEWAERGQGVLPQPDMVISLSMATQVLDQQENVGQQDKLCQQEIVGRKITIASSTPLGQNTLQKCQLAND